LVLADDEVCSVIRDEEISRLSNIESVVLFEVVYVIEDDEI
jgi:hypothetical protein